MAIAQLERPRHTKPEGNGSSAARVLEAVLPRRSWWERTFRWERNLTVAGKTIEKGFVVTPTMGLTIILAIAAMMGTLYWRTSDRIDAKDQAYQEQRDLLIRLDERLKEKNERDKEKMEQIEKRFQNVDAVQTVLGRDIAKISAGR